MSAVFQYNQTGIGDCLSNVLSRSGGDEFVVASDDKRRNPKALELGNGIGWRPKYR